MISCVFCKWHISVLNYGWKLLDIQCLSIYFMYLYVYYKHVIYIISNILRVNVLWSPSMTEQWWKVKKVLFIVRRRALRQLYKGHLQELWAVIRLYHFADKVNMILISWVFCLVTWRPVIWRNLCKHLCSIVYTPALLKHFLLFIVVFLFVFYL